MKAMILQPHYIGWIGLYAMIDACNVFVVYDDIQFEHQSWQHRNKIRNQDGWMWLTVPIIRREGQLINEVMINNSTHWQKDHWKSIQQNYSSTPYFKQHKEWLEEIYCHFTWDKLIDLNVYLLKILVWQLNIKIPQIVKSSEMATEGHKTDRLLPILKKLKADTYISGVGAKDYLEVKKLNDAGIEVKWFEYQHPVYPQKGEFIPYLSALDLLMNTGDKAIDYLRQGVCLVKG